jgi:aspartyl/asparaginyl beta-hydroxylase (cupin superfamily)
MFVETKTCYTWHRDGTARIHIPIITDSSKTGLIVEDTILRLPADGSAYIVDTTKYHTAFNAWDQTRIHLVAVIL